MVARCHPRILAAVADEASSVASEMIEAVRWQARHVQLARMYRIKKVRAALRCANPSCPRASHLTDALC